MRVGVKSINNGGVNREGQTFASLMYASKATMPFDRASLEFLEFKAAEHNRDVAITGYLTYRGERFTQFIEGPSHEIAALQDRIRRDSRHTILVEVDLGENPRRFPKWSMRLLDPLWHPTSSSLDAIDELLGTRPMSSTDKEVVRPSLQQLVAEVAGSR